LTRFCTVDDEDNLEIFLQMLKKEGFMVDYYSDAGNALFILGPITTFSNTGLAFA
jgi:hypothetical protein